MALIGIDCRFAAKPAGLGTYTRELVTHLVHSSVDDFVLFVRSADEQWLDEIPSHVAIITADFDHYSLKEQIQFPRIMKKLHLDLLFSPHFNVPYFCPVPFVATIHDLILHRYPNQTSLIKQLAYRILMKRCVKKARHIIAVSNYTSSEIASIYGDIISNKVSVVTEGVNPLFANAEDIDVFSQYSLPKKYFLYVGNAKEHKNVQMLIDAHAQNPDGPDLVLICSGSEASLLKLNERVHLLQDIPFEHLPSLYKKAVCFVTASLCEGFCLPILEARLSTCPVIAVHATAIPEVAGLEALLTDPTVDSLAEALNNPPTKTSPPGDEHNWETVAIETSAILSSVLYG